MLTTFYFLNRSGTGDAGSPQRSPRWPDLRPLPVSAAAPLAERPAFVHWRRCRLKPHPPEPGGSRYRPGCPRLLPVPALLRVPSGGHHQQPPGPGEPELRRAGRGLRLGPLPGREPELHPHGRGVHHVSREGGGPPFLPSVPRCLQEQPRYGRGFVTGSRCWFGPAAEKRTPCHHRTVQLNYDNE